MGAPGGDRATEGPEPLDMASSLASREMSGPPREDPPSLLPSLVSSPRSMIPANYCLPLSWQSMTPPYWKFSAISLCSWELSASSFSVKVGVRSRERGAAPPIEK